MACNSSEPDIKLSYSHEKIQAVMIDLYVAGNILDELNDADKDSLSTIYRDQIATIHDIDMNLYEQDLKTLQLQPKEYIKIHRKVKDSLAILEKDYKRR